ncbi:MAG TPA: CU044_5270 family protein [Streptosporangiaceae bacterium]|nr:CU044_5270 family protein [Streptosporangiaceae bacterium]
MNDMDLLSELAQETPLPAPAELGAARARLAAAIAASPAAERSAAAAVLPRRQPRPRRRLVLTGAVVAAVSAAAAAVLVSVWGRPAGNAGPGVAGGPGVNAAAARVLHRAALAALQLQAGAPRPDQFIYTKTEYGNGGLDQSWLSVDGARTGLVRATGGGGPASTYIPGCRDGHQLRVSAPQAEGGTPGGQACVPQPAYFPGMPASPQALRGYLKQTWDVDPGSPGYLNDFGKTADELLSQAYLSSGQRAALYDLLAQMPGLSLVPHATDSIGRHGIGISWSLPDHGGKTMIIFSRGTYAELGITTWGADGQPGAAALLKLAIVDQVGQLP